MKKLFSTAALLCCFAAFAQDCKGYWYLLNNAQVEMTVYDKNGKTSGVQTFAISDVKKDGGGYASAVKSNFKDEKGKEIGQSNGVYRCEGGLLKADVRMALPQEQMGTYKTEATLEPVYLEYPATMAVGQTLKDAAFEMNANNSSGLAANISFKQSNRKVETKEKITTPAGTWDAYKISYDGLFRIKTVGIGIPMNMMVKEWFVPGFGIVKTETYSKNGKLMGSTLITALRK